MVVVGVAMSEEIKHAVRMARAEGLLSGLLWWFEGEGKGQINKAGAAKIIKEVIVLIGGSK